MSEILGRRLFYASASGSLSNVSSLLREHPEIDVNWTNTDHYSSLHTASIRGHVEVVKLLLAHPATNVNVQDPGGETPISLGCENGHVVVVQLLLKDPRVDVTLADKYGFTPLWNASWGGHHEVIEWLIASGRDLGDIENKKGKPWAGGKDYTALEIARERNKTEAVSVLERFLANPTQTRHEVRVKLGVLDALAAEVFALTVFLCDNFLQHKPALNSAAFRFFTIAKRMPMELQMILCHRAVGSMKQNILLKDSEPAFRSLALIFSSAKFE